MLSLDKTIYQTLCTNISKQSNVTKIKYRHVASFSSAIPPPSFEIVDLPLRQTICFHKSTKLSYFAYSCYSSSFTSCLPSIHCFSEPSSYRKTILDPLWQQTMDEKLYALHKTYTWDLIPLPFGKSDVGCRLVYKIKTNSDGSIEWYKAGLVAKWYSQQYGMDYEETFAPVAKMTTIHTLIVVASVRQWHISQLDVKNTFLNGDLQEDVYMASLLVFHMILSMFESLRNHYMISNKHLMLGLKNSLLWSLPLVLFLVVMILLFLLSALI